MIRTGVFRYIRLKDKDAKLAQGWRHAADLGPTHGRWSVLMWWCCGDCLDGEAP